MNKLISAAAIACIALSPLYAASAKTAVNDVVYDGKGGIVRDGFGGCVRTVWIADKEKCNVQHKKSDVISEIMQMDERIIYFDFDKHNLKASEKDKLDVLAGVLKEHKIKAVKIVGYTDRIGTHKYNDHLSKQRAHEVKKYLNSKVKLEKSVVTLRGLGESNQVKACEDVHGRNELIDCLAPNRRVEVEVDYFDNLSAK